MQPPFPWGIFSRVVTAVMTLSDISTIVKKVQWPKSGHPPFLPDPSRFYIYNQQVILFVK
jgi:hypothetical protein